MLIIYTVEYFTREHIVPDTYREQTLYPTRFESESLFIASSKRKQTQCEQSGKITPRLLPISVLKNASLQSLSLFLLYVYICCQIDLF